MSNIYLPPIALWIPAYAGMTDIRRDAEHAGMTNAHRDAEHVVIPDSIRNPVEV